MPEQPSAADGTSTPLTVKGAAEKFAGLLTPQGHEDAREHPPEGAGAVEQDDATPSPEDRPSDATEQSADVETSETDTQEPQRFTVPGPDGKDEQVTLDELLSGYLRTADYTRKTMTLAEQRKAAEAEAASIREQRTQYAEGLTQLKAALEASKPPEPNWDELRREDPQAYAIQKLEWNEYQQRLDRLSQEQRRVAQEQMQEQAKVLQARVVEEQQKLLTAVPEWRDQAKAKTEMEKLVTRAKAYGFNDEEIGQVFDHRTVLLLRDAARYHELMAKKPDVRKKIEQVKTATPGSLKTPEKDAAKKRALAQLAKTGRVRDAAEAFLHRE